MALFSGFFFFFGHVTLCLPCTFPLDAGSVFVPLALEENPVVYEMSLQTYVLSVVKVRALLDLCCLQPNSCGFLFH